MDRRICEFWVEGEVLVSAMVKVKSWTKRAALVATMTPDWARIGMKTIILADFTSFQVSEILSSSTDSAHLLVSELAFSGFANGMYTKTEARQILVKMKKKVLA
jgi:hypothetical protein